MSRSENSNCNYNGSHVRKRLKSTEIGTDVRTKRVITVNKVQEVNPRGEASLDTPSLRREDCVKTKDISNIPGEERGNFDWKQVADDRKE